ncbi:MAG TPA: hypothetical protein VGZ22_08830 [Isosphaeraceae bacterium]|jgi:hypothetical protein|nr:hypothetical protein [Isosphaeraceae bacterium]
MSRSLVALIQSFEMSTYRENLFEQIFCSELLQGAWVAGLAPVEIDRPFVDFQGYDLVATCGAVTRHIQLKASRGGQLTVHRALALKPSACVVNIVARIVGDPERIAFTYRFFGSQPGQPLNLSGLKPAKKVVNTRQPDGEFAKSDRPNHLRVPHGRFSEPTDIVGLASVLFGTAPGQATLSSG